MVKTVTDNVEILSLIGSIPVVGKRISFTHPHPYHGFERVRLPHVLLRTVVSTHLV